MRRALALLLSGLLTGSAAANPLAYVLSSQETPPEIVDPAASNARESSGEPASEGELDAADLSMQMATDTRSTTDPGKTSLIPTRSLGEIRMNKVVISVRIRACRTNPP